MSEAATIQPVARKRTAALTLAALGVVFGDIGTSPLYTVKECFSEFTGLSPTQDNVLGILSLITWALIIVVTLKYVVVVMRADNRGEGGVLALMALVSRQEAISPRRRRIYLMIGVAGAALFYGDCLLTPAISVLSAVEGLKVATPALQPLVVPIALGVLVALFAVQKFGTGGVGRWFGPITLLWFVVLFVLGVRQIIEAPQVLTAFLPHHAIRFCLHHGLVAFLALGAVTLAVTGAEALYADMGHFGREPIRRAWLWLVLPALLANYYGQGALLLSDAERARKPVLPPRAGLGALSAGGARHRRHRDRLAGHHLRRLLDGAAGRAAGPEPARARPAHLGQRVRPDLRAGGQLAAARRRGGAGDVLQVVEQPRRRLRHRRHRHHADDHHAGVRAGGARLEMELGAGDPGVRRPSCWSTSRCSRPTC